MSDVSVLATANASSRAVIAHLSDATSSVVLAEHTGGHSLELGVGGGHGWLRHHFWTRLPGERSEPSRKYIAHCAHFLLLFLQILKRGSLLALHS